jgi:hypothetical protein
MFVVYRLVDPRTNKTKYIGITKANPHKRLCGHIAHCWKQTTKKDVWLYGLLCEGIVPTLYIVKNNLTEKEAVTKESELILKYKKQLVNTYMGRNMPAKVRLGISIKLTGVRKSKVHQQKLRRHLKRMAPEILGKKVVATKDGKNLFFKTLTKAAEKLGINRKRISRCCKDNSETGGYKFTFNDPNNQITN